MGGWVSLGGSAGYENTNQTQNQYGTRSPNVSADWQTAFGNLKNGVGANGLNSDQNTGLDYFRNFMSNNPVTPTTNTINNQLEGANGALTSTYNGYGAIAGQPSPGPVSATPVNAKTGASMAAPYAALYGQELIDPSLKAYDYGTDRAMTALDARTAAGGGFANSRSGINYGDLGAETSLGRGQLEAQLKTAGLTNALGFGQTDAGRSLTADTTNTNNALDADKFNVGAQQRNTDQRLQALGGQAQTMLSKAGLSQQVLQNVVTETGINTEAAQSLFAGGAISQAQLDSILQAAAAGNGFSFTQNSNTDTTKVNAEVHGGFG